MGLPLQTDEMALHDRICEGDPVAPTEIFETYMGALVDTLKKKTTQDEDEAHDASIDAIFEYLKKPQRYDRGKGRLFTYLMQIARKRAVDRIRSRNARARREQGYADVVELRAAAPNDGLERGLEAALLLERVEQGGLSERDRGFLRLVLEGERSTQVLAQALGLGGLEEDELKREVKRNRDRLMKYLKRLIKKKGVDDDEP